MTIVRAVMGGSGAGIPATVIDGKGDLVVGSAADTPARLPVGANGLVLKANSGAATGLEWGSGTAGTATFYNVKDYGAAGSGSGDDSQEVQAAIDAAAAAGGGTVFFPAGTYRMLTGLSLTSLVRLLGAGRGATVLDFSAMTTPVNNAAIYAGGSLTTLPALGSDIAKGGSTITFASAPSVSARDVLMIWNSADFSFSPARSYYRAGEIVRVVSVSGSTATLAFGTYAGYASGGTVSVRRMNPATVSIADLSVTAKTGTDGITLELCANSLLDNVAVTGSDNANFSVRRSYEMEIRNCWSVGYTTNIGLNYGLTVDSVQRCTVQGGHFDTTRHGVTTGSSSAFGGVPLRDFVITGAMVSSSSAGGGETGMDLHGSAERITMANCVFPNGVTLGGDHVLVTGCMIRGGGNGVAVYSGDLLGTSFHLVGNVITTTAPIGDSQRMLVEFGMTANMIRDGGTMRIVGNHLELADVRSAIPANGTYGIEIFWSATNTHTNNELVVESNTITTNYTGSQLFYGLLIDGVASTGFRTMTIRNNMLRGCGIQVRDIGAETCTIANNEVIGPANNGIYHRSTGAAPAFTGGLVNVYGNMVRRAQGCGMELRADTTATIRVANNISINNNQVGGTGNTNTDSSLFVGTCATAIIEGNVLGDNQGSPTQTRVYAVDTITNLYERNNHNVGSVTTVNSTSVTNEFDGYVNQAKTREATRSAAPTTGAWIVGDVVWNTAPAASGNIGWVCTTAGSPGTWKTFGTIAA